MAQQSAPSAWSLTGQLVSTSGVTAGIDGGLVMVALLRGDEAAQQVQLDIAYDPQPTFHAGSPATAPSAVLHTLQACYHDSNERRLAAGRAYQASYNWTEG